MHRRHYFQLACDEVTPERWRSWEHDPSDGSPGPIALEMYWVPLDQVPPLSGWLDDRLDRIPGRESGR